jgi:hypothetical protein
MEFDGECDDPDLEFEGRVDSDAKRDGSVSEIERGFDCDVLDSESDESVTFDICLGRSDGIGFGLDSESDASLDFGRSFAADFGIGSDFAVYLDLDGECSDIDRATGTSDLIASLDRVTE